MNAVMVYIYGDDAYSGADSGDAYGDNVIHAVISASNDNSCGDAAYCDGAHGDGAYSNDAHSGDAYAGVMQIVAMHTVVVYMAMVYMATARGTLLIDC